MNKSITIAIIGCFGGNRELLDGQTVKTKTLYEEIEKNTNWKIEKVDTYYKKNKPVYLLIKSLYSIAISENIIFSLSENGLKVYLPMLYLFGKFFNKKIYHCVIGGNIHRFVKNNKRRIMYLNSFTDNFVETNTIKNDLYKEGVTNCTVIPNFKNIIPISKNSIKDFENCKSYNFCTFSRVCKEKGIIEAIIAIERINVEYGINCTLDIYGKIDKDFVNEFKECINRSRYATYKGVVDYNDTVKVVKNYYALLFPTKWEGEGFAGTIIDSLASGTPIICTNFQSNKEIVLAHQTGLLYPNEEFLDLTQTILYLINNKTERKYMSYNCIEESINYLATTNSRKIINTIISNFI